MLLIVFQFGTDPREKELGRLIDAATHVMAKPFLISIPTFFVLIFLFLVELVSPVFVPHRHIWLVLSLVAVWWLCTHLRTLRNIAICLHCFVFRVSCSRKYPLSHSLSSVRIVKLPTPHKIEEVTWKEIQKHQKHKSTFVYTKFKNARLPEYMKRWVATVKIIIMCV